MKSYFLSLFLHLYSSSSSPPTSLVPESLVACTTLLGASKRIELKFCSSPFVYCCFRACASSEATVVGLKSKSVPRLWREAVSLARERKEEKTHPFFIGIDHSHHLSPIALLQFSPGPRSNSGTLGSTSTTSPPRSFSSSGSGTHRRERASYAVLRRLRRVRSSWMAETPERVLRTMTKITVEGEEVSRALEEKNGKKRTRNGDEEDERRENDDEERREGWSAESRV